MTGIFLWNLVDGKFLLENWVNVHMGGEGDSYGTNSSMAGFLIFRMVGVVGITPMKFQNVSITGF